MIPKRCPKCDADFDAGPIPDAVKHHYAGDGRFSRAISVDAGRDRHDHWQCPDCKYEWK
jgi:hypothetical protein